MALETFKIDTTHSSINFAVRHMVISKVNGRFTHWSGTISMDPDHFANSWVEVHIDGRSIQTDDPDRNAHLKSPDFLDVDNHPEISFVSNHIEAVDGLTYEVSGDLTLRGVTREVVLEATYGGRVIDMQGKERIGVEAKTTLGREDWGVSFNIVTADGTVAVGNDVEIVLLVEAVKQDGGR